jgi:hypothetical protein
MALKQFKVVYQASRAELSALVSSVLSSLLALKKASESSTIIANCSPSLLSDDCFHALRATSLADLAISITILFCILFLFWLTLKKVIDSWRKANIEPVGIFFDRVSELGKPTKAIEHSLVQVLRTPDGTLEYRGVGRRVQSKTPIDYHWHARDANVSKSDAINEYKLVFRNRPKDIKFISPRFRPDDTPLSDSAVHSVGVIEYRLTNGKPTNIDGIFFDYTKEDNKDYLARGRIKLHPADDGISKEAEKIFEEYFSNPEEPETLRKVSSLIRKVEQRLNE